MIDEDDALLDRFIRGKENCKQPGCRDSERCEANGKSAFCGGTFHTEGEL